ncbi:MAG: hypothetical protein HN722_01505 [Nitrospina sp.]|jgi:hypothetical protein|nr:hypothetical protein [Nitrospina sp.]
MMMTRTNMGAALSSPMLGEWNVYKFKNTHKRSIRKESQSLYGLAFFIGNFLGVSEWSTKD